MTLTPERWKTVSELFERALRHAPAEREGFVRSAAGDDAEMYQEVLSLLRAHEHEDVRIDRAFGHVEQMLDHVVHPTMPRSHRDVDAAHVGQVIGAWRIERLVDRGGMGAIYEVRRSDGQFEQRAALKLIEPGIDSNEIVARFHRERQILASLVHPAIARLLDGGKTAGGRPYFVMEFVDGVAIDRYCFDTHLNVSERITLFLRVCHGVQYAHRNLVVHRDLKPPNILVTADGLPKLLDFGIAKLLEQRSGNRETLTALTETGAAPLTPEYASPEQVRGDPVTTATDVYSLGVVLYELLTGRPPFRLVSRSLPELTRVLEEEPRPPSTVVSAEAAAATGERNLTDLRRRLRGDVDHIVLMALRKEPDQRYGSVAELADDLDRYLRGLPVRARRGSTGYRLRKFIKRHRTGVASAAVVGLALFVGAGATAWQARRATVQARVADAERARAEDVNAFLLGILSSADPMWSGSGTKPAEEATLLEAVDAAAGRLAAAPPGSPGVEAGIRRALGNAYYSLARLDDAATHLSAALALDRASYPDPHPTLARDLRDLGAIHHARGELDDAERLYRESLSQYRNMPELTEHGFVLVLSDLGRLQLTRGNNAVAEGLLLEALGVNRRIDGEGYPALAFALGNLAVAHGVQGDLARSADFYRDALEVLAGVPGRELAERGALQAGLGAVYKLEGRYQEADSLLTESLVVLERGFGPTHLALAYYALPHLADLRYQTGDPASAESHILRALSILRSSLPPDHLDIAWVESLHGKFLVGLGRAAEADRILRRVLARQRTAYSAGDTRVAQTAGALGLALDAVGKRDEAAVLLEESHRIYRDAVGVDHPLTREAAANLEKVAREH